MKSGSFQYLTCPGEGGKWIIVDRARDAVPILTCRNKMGASLLASLMNGDLAVLADASPEMLAQCRSALCSLRRGPRAMNRPLIGTSAFPQL